MLFYLYFIICLLLGSCVIKDIESVNIQQQLSDSIGSDLSLKTTDAEVENNITFQSIFTNKDHNA